MEIRLGYELSFEVPRPTPMQLMLYVHPEQASRLRRPERIEIEPATAVEDFVDEFGNRAARLPNQSTKLSTSPTGPVWMASGCRRAGTVSGCTYSISSIGVGRGISKISSWPMRIRMGPR